MARQSRVVRSLISFSPVLLLIGVSACSSSDHDGAGGSGTAASSGSALAPPADGQGVQFEMQTTIDASTEDERCKFVTTTDDLWVHQESVRYTPGSHHFILWNTTYTSIPTQDTNGNTVDTSGVFECPGGPPNGWNVDRYVGGSQSADAPSVLGQLPDDVAFHVPAGSVLMMDLHILNATANPLPVTVQINLNTIPQAQVAQEAGIFFFYNPFIAVPPASASEARMRCPVTSNINLTTAQTHMHKWGLGGSAMLEDSASNMIEQLYTSDTWTDPKVTQWSAPPKALQAGQQIDYECNYQNNDATTVVQGLSAVTNEMCVFVGAYYPRDEKFETCGKTGNFNDQESAATFVGSGTATCGATLGCLQKAASSNDPAPFYTCIVDSCPGTADALTTFLNCAESLPSGGDVTTVCSSQISACLAATCGGS